MIVRELVALLGFEVDKKSASTAEAGISGMVANLKKLAVVAAAVGVGVALKSIAEGVGTLGDEIDTTAQRLGVTTKALQEMRFVADRADVSREELSVGLRQLARNAVEAGEGNKEAAEGFAKLGVSARGADGKVKPVEQLMQEMGDGFQRLGTDIERTAMAQQLFGRSGTALLPMLAQGSKGIEDMRKRAYELGAVLEDDLIKAASDWDDSNKDVRDSIQGIKNIVGRALLPVLTAWNKAFVRLLMTHGAFIRGSLTRVLQGLAQVLGSVLSFTVKMTDGVVRWLSALSPLQQKILGVTAALAGLLLLLALPGGALVLLAGLIALIIDDFMTWQAGGESAIGGLVGSLANLKAAFPTLFALVKGYKDLFVMHFQAITNFVGSFIVFLIDVWDSPLQAAQTFASNLALIWEDIVKAVRGVFGDTFASIFRDTYEAVWTLTKGWIEMLINLFMSFVTFFSDLFTEGVSTAFSNLFDNLLATAKDTLGAVGKLVDKVFSLGGSIGAAFGLSGTAATTPAAAAPVAVGRAIGGVSSAQTNNVNVTVNAPNATDPDAIGAAVKREIDAANAAAHRQALGDLTVATP